MYGSLDERGMIHRVFANETVLEDEGNCREENPAADLSFKMNHRNHVQISPRPLGLRWAASEAFPIPVRIVFGARRRELPGRAHAAWNQVGRLALLRLMPLAMIIFLAGCSSPAVRQQRLVAKPNMLFSDFATFSYNSPKLLPQLAPGFAGSGGAQNSGCTSCR